MNLQRLETFLAVAASGSFRVAADTLHRSPSAVSKQVQQLEADLGVPLLERTTRRVTLTTDGRMLLTRSKVAIEELRAIAAELRDHADLRRGRVSVGAVPSVSSQRLPAIIAAFKARHPGVAIELHEGFARRVYQDVQERLTDFAIVPRIADFTDLRWEKVLTDPLVAVLPERAGPGEERVSLDDLAGMPHLCMPRGTALRESVEELYRRARLPFHPAIEVSHHQTLYSLVAAGLGVALLPSLSVPAGRPRGWRVARLRAAGAAREMGLVTLKGRTLSPAAARCAELVVAGLRAAATEAQARRTIMNSRRKGNSVRPSASGG